MSPHWPTLLAALRASLSPRRLRARQVLGVVLVLAAVSATGLFTGLWRVLDGLLAGGFREVEVKRPIFILANPRSGTTFLHRLLSLDPQFTHLKLYHTLFPSVLLFRAFEALGAADAAVGGPLAGLVARFNRLAFRGWEGIHTVALERAEEDEMLWVYRALSPALVLLFPFFDELGDALRVDRLPPEQRERLAAGYRADVQRRMALAPPGTTLLAKNALAQGRIRTCLQAFPDLRVIHLVRHPYDATASLMSMFAVPWRAHSPHLLGDTPEMRRMARELGFTYYRLLMELKRELPPEQLVEVRYDDLLRDTPAAVESIYRHFDLPLDDAFRATLRSEFEKSRAYESKHKYRLEDYGLSRELVYEELKDVFDHYGFPR